MRHQKRSRQLVLPAAALGGTGFGSQKQTVLERGVAGTDEVQFVFEMRCGHRIGSIEEAGRACLVCAAELVRMRPDLGAVALNWESTTCASCWRPCVVEGCVGACARHSRATDVGVMCLEHLVVWEQEQRYARIRERHGGIVEGVVRLLDAVRFEKT